MSVSNAEVRDKIINLYPEIRKYDLDIVTEFSDEKNAWIVTLVKNGETLFTHIETEDVEKCIEGQKCMYFTNQLMGFIDAYCTDSDICEV